MMRLYRALCEYLEALAAHARTDTLEHEFEHADWSESQGAGWDED
jgi:hypothetical protein